MKQGFPGIARREPALPDNLAAGEQQAGGLDRRRIQRGGSDWPGQHQGVALHVGHRLSLPVASGDRFQDRPRSCRNTTAMATTTATSRLQNAVR